MILYVDPASSPGWERSSCLAGPAEGQHPVSLSAKLPALPSVRISNGIYFGGIKAQPSVMAENSHLLPCQTLEFYSFEC